MSYEKYLTKGDDDDDDSYIGLTLAHFPEIQLVVTQQYVGYFHPKNKKNRLDRRKQTGKTILQQQAHRSTSVQGNGTNEL